MYKPKSFTYIHADLYVDELHEIGKEKLSEFKSFKDSLTFLHNDGFFK